MFFEASQKVASRSLSNIWFRSQSLSQETEDLHPEGKKKRGRRQSVEEGLLRKEVKRRRKWMEEGGQGVNVTQGTVCKYDYVKVLRKILKRHTRPPLFIYLDKNQTLGLGRWLSG